MKMVLLSFHLLFNKIINLFWVKRMKRLLLSKKRLLVHKQRTHLLHFLKSKRGTKKKKSFFSKTLIQNHYKTVISTKLSKKWCLGMLIKAINKNFKRYLCGCLLFISKIHLINKVTVILWEWAKIVTIIKCKMHIIKE